jgi:hypothetical protein
MKKYFIRVNCFTFPILTLLILVSLASGETYQSSFGFSINIPPHWLIMNGEEIKKILTCLILIKGPSKMLTKTLSNKLKTRWLQVR